MRPSTPSHAAAAPPFVAVSHLTVPEDGRAAVVAAFGDRLGAVDSWPGFQGLQVWADPGDPRGFRTNVALFNMGTGSCTAQVGVFDTSGSLLAAATTYTIPARTMVQLNRLKNSLGIGVDVQDASVGVKALSAACRLGAAGYVVSNSTNDPFTSLMRKGASLF